MNLPLFKFALTNELVEACKGTEFDEGDFIPTKAEPKATGWDVRCAMPEGLNLKEGCYYMIPLGILVFCPDGWWYELESRSSTFIKRNLHSLDGKIDELYPQELKYCCQFLPDACKLISKNKPQRIEFGERIAQIIPVKRNEIETQVISLTEMMASYGNRASQRTGGFGSTGDK